MTRAPSALSRTQYWFASILSHPLVEDLSQELSPRGISLDAEAEEYIAPSPTLRPHERIQIYNQQYWWRLLNALQDHFPLITRFLGQRKFNEKIGVPYLKAHPPSHWSLSIIAKNMPAWLKDHYKEDDLSLLIECATLDWAFTACYISPYYLSIDLNQLLQSDPDCLLTQVFYLQPSVQLLFFHDHLFDVRKKLLQESVEYWDTHPLPKLKGKKELYFLLHRRKDHQVAWKEIEEAHFLFLQCFKNGSSVENACQVLSEKGDRFVKSAEKHLQSWITEAVQAELFTLQPPTDGVLFPF